MVWDTLVDMVVTSAPTAMVWDTVVFMELITLATTERGLLKIKQPATRKATAILNI